MFFQDPGKKSRREEYYIYFFFFFFLVGSLEHFLVTFGRLSRAESVKKIPKKGVRKRVGNVSETCRKRVGNERLEWNENTFSKQIGAKSPILGRSRAETAARDLPCPRASALRGRRHVQRRIVAREREEPKKNRAAHCPHKGQTGCVIR